MRWRSSHATNASRVADAFVAWEERQRTAAAARARAKGRRMSINGDFDAATLSLMLWDLHCTISYAQASGRARDM